jgi:outer membrane protein assembly factor BamB/beta-lactamase superfamily II metal-dependent hydrolase
MKSGYIFHSVVVAILAMLWGVSQAHAGNLEIYCIEVGLDDNPPNYSYFYNQGDATLIISPSGKRMLIDGGAGGDYGANSVLALFNRIIPTGGLDYMVTTHWDTDHAGGLDDIATYNSGQYMPTTIYDLGDSGGSSYDSTFSGRRVTPSVGDTIDLGGNCTAMFVTVDGNIYGGGYINPGDDKNARSIGLLIRYGGFDYLTLGDLLTAWEDDLGDALVSAGYNIDVLRASHHGSYNSTSNSFVSGILPEYAVISCGDTNSYGHPSQQAINRLNALDGDGDTYYPSYAAVSRIYLLEEGTSRTGSNLSIVGAGSYYDPAQQGSLKIEVSGGGTVYSFSNEGPNTYTISDGPFSADDYSPMYFSSYAIWPMFHYNICRTGLINVDCPSNPVLAWSYVTADALSSSPALSASGTAYIGGEDAIFYSLSSQGDLQWSYCTGGPILSSAAISTDVVFIGSDDGNLYALQSDGGIYWSYPTADCISSSAAVTATGTVYVGSEDNTFYSISSSGVLYWSYQAGDSIVSSPSIGYDTAYIGSDDNVLYALWLNGGVRWSYGTADCISAAPGMNSTGTVYIGSEDNIIRSIDEDGVLQWSYETAGPVVSTMAVSTQYVYVGSSDDNLYAFQQDDGALCWSYKTGGDISASPGLGLSDTVCVGSEDNVLYCIDSAGALNWSYLTGQPILSSVAISTGTVYVGSDDNTLHVIGE